MAEYAATTVEWTKFQDEEIDERLVRLHEQAMRGMPPSLQLLLDWLINVGEELDDLDDKVDAVFKKLEEAFPNNPFIYLYWADAIKISPRLGLSRTGGKKVVSFGGEGLPVAVMEEAIRLCEKAHSVAPNMAIVSGRIAGMALPLAATYAENSLDQKKWFKKLDEHAANGKLHMQEMSRYIRDDDPLVKILRQVDDEPPKQLL